MRLNFTKILAYLALFLLLFCGPALAVDFVWSDPNKPAGTVNKYVFYINEVGATDNPYIGIVDYPVMKYTLADNRLVPGVEYEFWVTAFSFKGGESGKSNIVTYTAANLFYPPDISLPPIHISVPPVITTNLKIDTTETVID